MKYRGKLSIHSGKGRLDFDVRNRGLVKSTSRAIWRRDSRRESRDQLIEAIEDRS